MALLNCCAYFFLHIAALRNPNTLRMALRTNSDRTPRAKMVLSTISSRSFLKSGFKGASIVRSPHFRSHNTMCGDDLLYVNISTRWLILARPALKGFSAIESLGSFYVDSAMYDMSATPPLTTWLKNHLQGHRS